MKITLSILLFYLSISHSLADILIFKNCKSNDYSYEKNEYILDLNKGVMTRKFIYDEVSYKKLRLNDINIKKINTTNKGITEENDLIVSDVTGYPAFYTQLVFNKERKNIKIKTVLNNTIGESLISKCENVLNYKKES